MIPMMTITTIISIRVNPPSRRRAAAPLRRDGSWASRMEIS
jgi:hypothetical protein